MERGLDSADLEGETQLELSQGLHLDAASSGVMDDSEEVSREVKNEECLTDQEGLEAAR